MKILTSQRIRLRPVEIEDGLNILSYRSVPDIYKYQNWRPKTETDVVDFIINKIVREPNIPGSWLQLAICTRDKHEFIGDCGIHFLEDEPEQVEIGITIKREHQHKGYASEVLEILFNYIFIDLQKHRIIASVDPGNTASIKLLEKIKMRKEAHFIKSMFIDGKWVDDIRYAILEDEWKSREKDHKED